MSSFRRTRDKTYLGVSFGERTWTISDNYYKIAPIYTP